MSSRFPALSFVLVLLLSLLWRVPSLVDPPWVNDEGTYFAVAQAMAHGYRLYVQVWENKPPAVYLLYEAVYHSLGPSLLGVRLLALIAVLATVALVILISGHFAALPVALASGLFAGLLLGVPFLEGTTANAETFLAAFTAFAVWLAILKRWPVPAGLAAGVAVLFKAVAGFDALAIALWLAVRRRGSLRFVAAIAATLLLAGLAVWRAGVLPDMLRDAFLYDFGYVGHANGPNLPWLLALKLAALLLIAIWLREKPFPYFWLAFAAAGALFSGRIFGHYFVQVIAPLCVSLACIVDQRAELGRRALVLLPAAFLAAGALSALVGWSLAATGHNSILARRLQYYANFARLALGLESYGVYRDQVDDHVTRNIRLAADVRTLPAGQLLVWGNVPWVYVLSGRLPATPYTSALRDPPVPGETADLRRAVGRSDAPVVVIEPARPPLGPAATQLRDGYRVGARVGNAIIYLRKIHG
jgi:4-amino-4-deoxy-L-arabinose transferase-like glycosyltransferase